MTESRPAARPSMRTTMPLTAQWVNECREKFGSLHVDTCLRSSLAGRRNAFYAVEAGHIVGTPFDWNDRATFIVSMSVLTGAKFIAAIAEPGTGICAMAVQPALGGVAA